MSAYMSIHPRHPELVGAWLAPSPGIFAVRFKT
jgi:hypothetical protein